MSVCRLCFSPHLASWLTSSVSFLDPNFEGLSEAERAERLSGLRTEMGLTDTEVVERAATGSLARDPLFAEWLVLLGRGDLLAH